MHQEKWIDTDDAPRSMRDAGVRQRRFEMLNAPHVIPLTEYTARLRERGNVEVPNFDPLDGGVEARALFLFEKPGPMTAENRIGKRAGSGFISRNNDDPTAEATFQFMEAAEIPRKETIIWNVVPWWNGTRKIKNAELKEGVAYVKELIGLLPKLRAVILVGKRAAAARPYLDGSGLALFTSDHPSPLVKARWLDRWLAITSEWAKIKTVL